MHSRMKHYIFMAITAMFIIFTVGCAKDDIELPNNEKVNKTIEIVVEENEPTVPKDTVTISIETGNVQGTILSATKVALEDGDTILDVTNRIVKEKGIQISVRGSGSSAYVEGINNLYEMDEGPLSGWIVEVDGAPIDRSVGAIKIQANQSIKWIFTENYLEES